VKLGVFSPWNGTQPLPRRSGALQLDRAADDLDDVDARQQLVNERRRDHGEGSARRDVASRSGCSDSRAARARGDRALAGFG
jgi:hypothetical protein